MGSKLTNFRVNKVIYNGYVTVAYGESKVCLDESTYKQMRDVIDALRSLDYHGEIGKGVTNCSDNDVYVRKMGKIVASDKAEHQANAFTRNALLNTAELMHRFERILRDEADRLNRRNAEIELTDYDSYDVRDEEDAPNYTIDVSPESIDAIMSQWAAEGAVDDKSGEGE